MNLWQTLMKRAALVLLAAAVVVPVAQAAQSSDRAGASSSGRPVAGYSSKKLALQELTAIANSHPHVSSSHLKLAVSRSLLLLTAALAFAVATSPTQSPAAGSVPSSWSLAVTGICDHALLFDGPHRIGTRPGAIAVARDIRASTARRLERIKALGIASPQPGLSDRWLILERRLADAFATDYLRIYDAIDAAKNPRQRSQLPRILERLVHAPDHLRVAAAILEQRLLVPDCTGGGTPAPPSEVTNRREGK